MNQTAPHTALDRSDLKHPFLMAGASLAAVVAVTEMGTNPVATGTSEWQTAHFLSHLGDTLYVVAAIFLLLGPPIVRFFKGNVERSLWWIWDATICQFAIVDGIGKARLSGLHRPSADSVVPGFPSGHAAYAFLVCWLIALRYPRLAPWYYVGAVAICWSRVALGAHYPYQVIAGAIVGTLLAWGTSSLKQGFIIPRIIAPFTKTNPATTPSPPIADP